MTPELDPFRESTGLYVLGALPPEERRAFEVHLETCEACASEVRALQAVAGALPYGVQDVDPPAALRARVLHAAAASRTPSISVPLEPSRHTRSSETPSPARRSGSVVAAWLVAAASIVLAAGLGMYAGRLASQRDDVRGRLVETTARLEDAEQQLQFANRDVTQIRARLALLTAPDVVELQLAGQTPAPSARARAFLSRSRGLLFTATNLPPIPGDRTYQLWYLTRGAPVSAGLLRPDAQGTATVSFDVGTAAPVPTGMAVSLEPAGGVPAPTGAIYLATQ